ncbi:MAG: hypothetical protein IPL79_00935 [Myxococcales bacterium]|nr:hypothetical protein [Myxococcales bacterium]
MTETIRVAMAAMGIGVAGTWLCMWHIIGARLDGVHAAVPIGLASVLAVYVGIAHFRRRLPLYLLLCGLSMPGSFFAGAAWMMRNTDFDGVFCPQC